MAEILNRFAYAIAAEVDPRAFREFERQGIAAGSAIKTNFAGIQSVINDALSVPRNAFGGLDLGIAKLREMERDLESVAVASREVARASKQAEIAEGQTNRERVASIRNANAFATVKEQELARLRQEISLQERIQAELNQTASATDRVIAANRGGASAQDELVRSVRGQRQAYIQANQQFQDIAISLAGGQRASTVLAQQLPQLGFALKDASGFAGRFGTLLSGPAGIGIIGGLLVLGPLIDEGIRKLFGYGEAADEAAKATKKLEEAQKAEIEAAGKLADIAGDEEKRLAKQAELYRLNELNLRNLTAARLADALAIAEASARANQSGGLSGQRSEALGNRANADLALVASLKAQLAASNAQLARLESAATARLQQVVVNRTKLLSTPEGRINARFDQQEKDARGRFGNNFGGLSAEIKRINEERKKQLDLIKETSKAETAASTERRRQINADIPTVAQLSKAVREAFPGSRVTSGLRTPERNRAVGGAANSRHLTGQAIDFVAPAGVTIGDVRSEFRRRGIELKEALDEGDHFHIAVDKGKVELQGYADAARDAQKATEEFNRTLSAILGDFDKGADLAAKFEEQIRQIKSLEKAGSSISSLPTKGLLEQGNIDLTTRPRVRNADGSISTVRSASFGTDRGEVLVPTVTDDGKIITVDQAIDLFYKEGKHLGIFASPKDATDFAEALHRQQEADSGSGRGFDQATSRRLQDAARNALFAANDNLNREAEIARGEAIVKGYQRGLEIVLVETGDAISQQLEDSIFEATQKALGRLEREGFIGLNAVGKVLGNGPASLLASLSRRSNSTDGVNSFLNNLGKGFDDANQRLADKLNSLFNEIFGSRSGAFAQTLGAALAGAQTGSQVASIGKSLGVKTSKLGGQIGGSVGAASGIPGGEIIGSIIGSVVGGLFKKTPKGVVSISNSGSSFTGSGKLRSGLTSTGDSVSDTLASIAEQLGGTLGSFSASIRQKKNSFFVGTQKFSSAEDAAQATILQVIQQGAISGIDAGAQRLLQSGKKLDEALKKAVSFQGALDKIKESTDPLGAALARITREFGSLRTTFTEAGATAEQFAGLAALEAKERKSALENITASLRDLQRENSFGDTGRSLRDRQAAALAAFNPLEARVKAGDATAFDQFADIGRQLRDINREIFGSQGGYFEFLDRLQATTNAAIAGQENIAGLNATAAPVVSAIDRQTEILVNAMSVANDNNGKVFGVLTEISAKLSTGGSGQNRPITTYFA